MRRHVAAITGMLGAAAIAIDGADLRSVSRRPPRFPCSNTTRRSPSRFPRTGRSARSAGWPSIARIICTSSSVPARCGATSASPAPATRRPRPTAAFRPRRCWNSIRRGKLIHSWGGPGAGYDWPQTEHGVFVDQKDTVWLAGSGENDAQLLKFTREGKFLQQFGKPGTRGGSSDTSNLGQPANLTVDPVSNEVYVADGYRNRRVIVLDADTFAFKRLWGAYGNKPDDTPLGPYNPDAPPAQQFRLPHNIAISRDGFVYVADRPNNRIQVFRKDGTYVNEVFVVEADAAARARPRGSRFRPIRSSVFST